MSRHQKDSWFIDFSNKLSNKQSVLQVRSFEGRSITSGLQFSYHGQTNAAMEPEGEGDMHFENGDFYKGHWWRGKLHGYGEVKLSNRKKYVGAFQNGKQHGSGKFTWHDGEFYEGEWKFGLFDGFGIYGTPDGVELYCMFKNGLPVIGSKCQVLS
jgi:hypothetical protein